MSTNDLILVTGGTGNLGSRVVKRLRQAGRPVRVLSRKPHAAAAGVDYVVGDLATGEGVEAAVAGVGVIVHCSGTPRIAEEEAQIGNLLRSARGAGVRHIVNISVVGADRIPVTGRVDRAMFSYFAGQLAVEKAIAESGIPWTNLRATQFHDGFILLMAQAMTKLPVVTVPAGFRFQPVETEEVADRLAELALGEPVGMAPDLAGPKIYKAAELIRGYVRATGKRRVLVPMPLPGRAAAAVRRGANLAPDRAVGRRTWEDFLAAGPAS